MSNSHGEWLDRIRGRHRKKNRMKDDEIVVMFCNPHDALEFLDGEDTGKIDEFKENFQSLNFEIDLEKIGKVTFEDCIVMSPLIPVGEVTLVPKDEFLDWLKGDR